MVEVGVVIHDPAHYSRSQTLVRSMEAIARERLVLTSLQPVAPLWTLAN